MATTVKLRVASARRQSDPLGGNGERHSFLIKVGDLPLNLSLEPNPRDQRIDRGIYRTVSESLLANDGNFLWKNHGITILAKAVRKIDDRTYAVEMESSHHGVVDGGHTYEIIKEALSEDGSFLDTQAVEVRVFTGIVPERLDVVEVAGALNTTMQVQEMSLANLAGKFDWLKDLLKDEPYADKIAWKENQKRVYDARDLVVLIDVFNVRRFSVDGEAHPTRAYNNKGEALKDYVKEPEAYARYSPIVKDILKLHDHISSEGPVIHNKQNKGRAGALDIVKTKKGRTRDGIPFHFLGTTGDMSLDRAALLPMLGAFRWMIEEKPDGTFGWRGTFEDVLGVWRSAAEEMMKATIATHREYKYKLTNLGKSGTHWGTMFNIVARHDLQKRSK